MKFVFLPEALLEFEEAAAYIGRDSAQNARLLIERVEEAIAYILKHPDENLRGRYGTLRRKIRRQSHWLVYRRLPNEPETIEIIALAHEKRGETYWQKRFSSLHQP